MADIKGVWRGGFMGMLLIGGQQYLHHRKNRLVLQTDRQTCPGRTPVGIGYPPTRAG